MGCRQLVRRKLMIFTILFIFFVVFVNAEEPKIITLTSENWKNTLEGEWLIKFYAPWCPACRAMEEDFKSFADWSDDLNVNVAEVNINEEPGLSGRFIVTALPTLYHSKDGEFRRYTGPRDSNALHKFVELNTWKSHEPVAWYRHPDSILMTLMAALFQTSVIMKNFHETLTETYGFSTTASYIIFGLATIVTGLVLGLILVFIIDCISPVKPRGRKTAESIDETAENKSADEQETDEDGANDSMTGSEEEQEDNVIGKGDSSAEEEERISQSSSQSSSRTSQEWEQVQGAEAEAAQTELSTERTISAEEEEEGQGEVRKRKIIKPGNDGEAEDN